MKDRLSRPELMNFLDVSPQTGKCYWRNPPRTHPDLKGTEAGSIRWNSRKDRAYWIIQINRIPYKRSHVVYFVATGSWPKMIDHANGDSLDDRSVNIREATITQNNWNHTKRRKKSPLPMGIRTMGDKFQARIACNKKTIYRTFRTPNEAVEFYRLKRAELFGEFSGLEAL